MTGMGQPRGAARLQRPAHRRHQPAIVAPQGAARLAGSSAEALTQGITGLNDNLTLAAIGRAPPSRSSVSTSATSSPAKSATRPTCCRSLADKLIAVPNPAIRMQSGDDGPRRCDAAALSVPDARIEGRRALHAARERLWRDQRRCHRHGSAASSSSSVAGQSCGTGKGETPSLSSGNRRSASR